MMRETEEEVMGCKDQTQVIKGKRTKRQRPLSLLTLTIGSSSSSGGESGGEGETIMYNPIRIDREAMASPATSVAFTRNTEEEEDMANCLILLAQGQTRKPSDATTRKVTTGLYVYECKTCNRCFPSFQALGGHRASHKKPKAAINGEKKVLTSVEEDGDRFNHMNTTLSLQMANRALCCSTDNKKSNKVHECSLCGAEFSSGQALGGHMRRHRAFTSTTTTTTRSYGTSSSPHESQESKKTRSVLQLDLNLPAPEADHRESKFPFASKGQIIVFSASSLVDCHY
ncbi:zf-C2H2_6 domain-containing protein [Cephalotus follicularis]|uniref:Zf-C2H2_6 domain-containing protein n=1 Tax=Cephalotus follicularis TaxID=3775 RepID=A0A1Q3DB02_CEPFO|nr:zf-C2H2_6 domain-containing protein [Cephalotus follicularis]